VAVADGGGDSDGAVADGGGVAVAVAVRLAEEKGVGGVVAFT